MTSRRYLPSLSLLTAFEAAARTESFTGAAGLLNLTQSAVSRQIKALEEQIGITLFIREKQKVRLTAVGTRYAEDIRKALKIISNASISIQTNPDGGVLNLAILPSFGSHWLAPRLSSFLDTNPGITINFTTRMKPFDFDVEPLDAAIHYGLPSWSNVESAFLMSETVIPVCAPGFFEGQSEVSIEQILSSPLFHHSSRPNAWVDWFKAHGVITESIKGMAFDQFATAAQAAKNGLGLALLPRFLIERELAKGELIPANSSLQQSEQAYFLVWPKNKSDFPPLVSFKNWIVSTSCK